jgi:hypothetical protein
MTTTAGIRCPARGTVPILIGSNQEPLAVLEVTGVRLGDPSFTVDDDTVVLLERLRVVES